MGPAGTREESTSDVHLVSRDSPGNERPDIEQH